MAGGVEVGVEAHGFWRWFGVHQRVDPESQSAIEPVAVLAQSHGEVDEARFEAANRVLHRAPETFAKLRYAANRRQEVLYTVLDERIL